MSDDIGPVEQWAEHTAQQTEQEDVGRTRSINIDDARDFARAHDAEDAALRAALRQAGEALRNLKLAADQLVFDRKREHGWLDEFEAADAALAAIEALEVTA